MPWFAVDDGFHGHPKTLDLSLAAVGLWAMAGSWCAKYLTDGRVTDRVLTRMGGTPEIAAELVDAGLWIREASGYRFHEWDEYQRTKEQVEAERAAARSRMNKVRATKKGVSESTLSDVRPNSDGTTAERSDEQPPNVRENFERGSEEVRIAPSPPLPPTVSSNEETVLGAQKRATKTGTRIPADFAVTPEMRDWAKANTPHVDVDAELPKFIDYWTAKSGRDATKLDWPATWRNWMRNAAERTGTRGPAKIHAFDQAKSVVARFAAQSEPKAVER